MRRLINNPDNIVDEMLEGYEKAFDQVKLLEEDKRVVIRSDGLKEGKVGVIIGGGSGHEPLFMGYVGEGFADAAVVGDINTSPSPNVCYDAVKAVDTGAGCIFLYGNYTGDVLNFDMAVEMAGMDGIRVESLQVTDDVVSAKKVENRRGIAGDFFVFKIAGAAADKGYDLDMVLKVAKKANSLTASMGVAMGAAEHPATGGLMFDLPEGQMEVGMGIHGEPGVRRGPVEAMDDVVEEIMEPICEQLEIKVGDEVAILVDGLGATPYMDLFVMNRKVAEILDGKGVKRYKTFIGTYASTMNMPGQSVTLFKLDNEMKELLDYPTSAPYFVQK